MGRVPSSRVSVLNQAPLRPERDFVLYWMVASRRVRWSYALDRAAELAREAGKPLLVFEPLRCGYRWASDRLHRFIMDGMADNQRALAARGVTYFPYLEPEAGAGKGLLAALGARACAVVTDDYPTFFIPRMQRAAAAALDVQLEAVDGNGLYPIRASARLFARAVDLRRYYQRELRPYLVERPQLRPLDRLPRGALRLEKLHQRWPAATADELAPDSPLLARLPIDHSVAPVKARGGSQTAARRLRRFIGDRMARYAEQRNHPDADAASGLSPFLHFGHLSAHEVFHAVARHQGWDPLRLGDQTRGGRRGFWGMSEPSEAFLDELVVWRELGFNMSVLREDHDRLSSLPAWARQTLALHAGDARPHRYELDALERAQTHAPIWNAAQRELLQTGRMHNYLRMVWGKKVLEWSATPEAALAALVELNNKYALDGRDPNSYSGILWVFGRYDRAWGPQRPIFGKVRYMSLANTRRKLRMSRYLERFGTEQA